MRRTAMVRPSAGTGRPGMTEAPTHAGAAGPGPTPTMALDPLEPLPLLRRELGTGERGLSAREAARRLAVYGPNEVRARHARRWDANSSGNWSIPSPSCCGRREHWRSSQVFRVSAGRSSRSSLSTRLSRCSRNGRRERRWRRSRRYLPSTRVVIRDGRRADGRGTRPGSRRPRCARRGRQGPRRRAAHRRRHRGRPVHAHRRVGTGRTVAGPDWSGRRCCRSPTSSSAARPAPEARPRRSCSPPAPHGDSAASPH